MIAVSKNGYSDGNFYYLDLDFVEEGAVLSSFIGVTFESGKIPEFENVYERALEISSLNFPEHQLTEIILT